MNSDGLEVLVMYKPKMYVEWKEMAKSQYAC